jgi:hypothetical protein
MRKTLPFALALLLPLAAWSAETVTFRFAPPDGTTFVQTLVTTKTLDAGAAGKRTDVQRSETRLRFDKAGDGWTLTATPISMTMTRDGQAVQNPVLDALKDLVVTYRLDAQGNIVAIQGFGNVQEKLIKALPPEAAQAVAKLVTEEAMVAKEKAEWAGRISDFTGESFELGSSWTSEVPFALPTGEEILYYTRTEIAEKARCGDRDCVRIRFRYDTDASAIGAKVGESMSEVSKGVGGPEVQIKKTTITGGGERLIDPATMLIHSETLERTMNMEGMGVSTEKREYTFEYQPVAAKP